MRLFVSITIPDALKSEIMRLQKELETSAFLKGTFVEPDNLHCTVAFFGSVPPRKAEEIKAQLATIAIKSGEVTSEQLSFNSHKKQTIIWVDLESHMLTILADTIGHLFPDYTSKRPYKGHVTLVRIKQIVHKIKLDDFVRSYTLKKHTWNVHSFDLMESVTFAQGPEYTLVQSYPLI